MNYIIKITDGCNMRCRYCCVGDKTEYGIISEEQLYNNPVFVAENTIAQNENSLNIIFHGGEPTLLNPDVYRNILKNITEKYPDIKFFWKMQTNGLSIWEKFLDLFEDYDFSIGVSLDGFSEHHDNIRYDCGGNPTYDRIIENIFSMQKRKIPVSALMVITAGLEHDYTFLDFFQKHDIPIKINPLIECGEAEKEKEIWLESGEYADYMIGVFEYMITHDITIDIQPLNSIFYKLINPSCMSECTFSDDCFMRFVAIDYHGNLYPCGRFCDIHMFCQGNVDNQTLPFRVVRPEIPESAKCTDCKYKCVCNGGCPFMVWNSNGGGNPMCMDYQKIFGYLVNDGLALMKKRLLERREQLYNENL